MSGRYFSTGPPASVFSVSAYAVSGSSFTGSTDASRPSRSSRTRNPSCPFQVELPLREFFEASSLGAQAARIDAAALRDLTGRARRSAIAEAMRHEIDTVGVRRGHHGNIPL